MRDMKCLALKSAKHGEKNRRRESDDHHMIRPCLKGKGRGKRRKHDAENQALLKCQMKPGEKGRPELIQIFVLKYLTANSKCK